MVVTRSGSRLAATYDGPQSTPGSAATTFAKTLAKALPPTRRPQSCRAQGTG
ncbi:hypothetical protein [Streptomyces sp. CB03911]|uniref:hypothetical protein n=1 Tax=Streptomyces sp. CB03911 TaxID=1804758 RepID=UPI0018FEF963|nr:hypothetical protein [Streptomyces sp. CB03911]